MHKILYVCVCYNDYENTQKLLSSISSAYSKVKNLELTVILSDNSNEGINIKFDKEKFDYEFIWLKNENIGYFPAFYKGVKSINNDVKNYDFVMVSNVDLALDENFFNDLIKVNYSENIGIIAPNIISQSNGYNLNPKIINPVTSFKLKLTRLIFSTFLFYPYTLASKLKNKLKPKNKKVDSIINKTNYIYAPHGSFIIFTKNYFKKEASYCYPRFLFGEEIFVAEECLLKDLKVMYKSSIKIYDKEHVSTSLLKSRFIAQEYIKSFDYLLKNYFKKDI